jgi:hypothetical protein
MAAFIPPQFSSPPRDGANIKPSEYLRRVNSNLALAAPAPPIVMLGPHDGDDDEDDVSQRRPANEPTKISGDSSSSSASSGISSGNQSSSSTPTGSLSSSTGASLRARANDLSLASSRAPAGVHDKTTSVAAGGTRYRPNNGSDKRFRDRFKRPARRPLGELNRSQSTSALNHLDSEDDDEQDEQDERDDQDEDGELDTFSDDGESINLSDHSARTTTTSGSTCSRTTTGSSNLLNELRNFDKSKLARMSSSSQSAVAGAATRQAGRHAGAGANGERLGGQADNLLLAATKRDLIAELKESKDLDGIKRMRDSHKSKEGLRQAIEAAMPVFRAEDFLHKVSEGEPELPLWRRQMLAKKAAERARKEHEDKLRLALEEKRLSQVPQWKRQMLDKKAAERAAKRSELEKAGEQKQQRHVGEMPTWRKQLARLKMTTSTGSINAIGFRGPTEAGGDY